MKFLIELDLNNIESLDKFREALKALIKKFQKPSKAEPQAGDSLDTETEDTVENEVDSVSVEQSVESREELKGEIASLNVKITEQQTAFDKKYNDLNGKYDNLIVEHEKLKDSLKEVNEAKDKLQKEIEDERETSRLLLEERDEIIKNLEGKNTDLKVEKCQLEETLESEQEKVTKLEGDVARLEAEKKATQTELDAEIIENKTLNESLNVCKENLNTKKVELGQEKQKHTQTQATLNATEKQLSVAEKKVTELQSKLSGHTLVHLEEYCCSIASVREYLELSQDQSFERRLSLIKALKSGQKLGQLWKMLQRDAQKTPITKDREKMLRAIVEIFNSQNNKKEARLIEVKKGDRFNDSKHYAVDGTSGQTVSEVYFYGLELTGEASIGAMVSVS